MADILLDEQSVPATPASGQLILYPDSTVSLPAWKNDLGKAGLMVVSQNASIADQAGFASDTYVTDSDILIPSFGLQARTVFEWTFAISKTAAGSNAPIYQVRIGTLRTTADTSRLSLTGPIQTTVADLGTLTIQVTVRSVSATGVLQGVASFNHRGTVATSTVGTGFANDATGHVMGTSAAYDNTGHAGQYIGISINGGAAAAWTMTQCRALARW